MDSKVEPTNPNISSLSVQLGCSLWATLSLGMAVLLHSLEYPERRKRQSNFVFQF